MSWSTYEKPKSLSEALAVLEQASGRGRVIAGGTDLILQLRQGQQAADLLVDITGIDELRQIDEKEGWIRIGAAVTHVEVAEHSLIQQEATALAQGCARVGSPQIRNAATLLGNVISAKPAGDGAVPLMALEAEIRVVSKAGERLVPLDQAYRGIGLSSVDSSSEVATDVRFRRVGDRGQTTFFRMARRRALALPVLNGAVSIRWSPSRTRLEEARISLGPVSDRPFRPRRAEARLISKEMSPQLIYETARIASEEASPRTSVLRGSEFYRKEMIRLYLARTLHELLLV